MSDLNTEMQTEPAGFSLPKDPAKAMQEMMDSIDEMRTVYESETKALDIADVSAFLDIQEQKIEATRRYQKGIEEMLSRRDEMRQVNPLIKKRLAEMQAEFAILAAKNKDAIGRMQRCTERLAGTIRSAAKEAATRQRGTSYGETGAIDSRGSKKPVSTGVSETA